MTTVPGNNITITASDIVGSTQGLIIRTPTVNSSDTLDTASSIILAYYGVNNSDYNGDSFPLRIYNNSGVIITLNSGTGNTLFPTSTDTILPQATHTYIVIKTSGTTLNCIMTSNGNASNTTGISLGSGNIVVGSTAGIGTQVTMSGDATIVSSGALTLANTAVTPGSYTNSNLTVDSKGRITTITNGFGSSVPVFFAYGPTAAISIGGTVAFTTLTTYNTPSFDVSTYSYSSGVVTLLVTGAYEISYTVQFNSNGNSGSAIGSFGSQILLNGATVVPGSITECSLSRIAGTNNRSFNTKTWIIAAVANNTVAIQWGQISTSTVAQVTQNQSVFTIRRLQ